MMFGNSIFKFKNFFLCNFNAVVRFVNVYICNESDSQDIAQETFLRLYEHWDSLPSQEEARSYMYAVARNLCMSYLRHQSVEIDFMQKTMESPDKEEAEEQMFLHEVTYQETMRLLREAIDKLPQRSRQIILLGLDGKNNVEIANIMGVSVNTVKTLKKSAYKSLREAIGNLPEDYFFFILFLLMKS